MARRQSPTRAPLFPFMAPSRGCCSAPLLCPFRPCRRLAPRWQPPDQSGLREWMSLRASLPGACRSRISWVMPVAPCPGRHRPPSPERDSQGADHPDCRGARAVSTVPETSSNSRVIDVSSFRACHHKIAGRYCRFGGTTRRINALSAGNPSAPIRVPADDIISQ